MQWKHFLGLLVFFILISGCESTNEEQTLYVAAASDLFNALTEIGDEFTKETGIQIEYTFGSTGLLTQQIQEGAPFDLFTAAHESYIDKLIEVDAVDANSKEYYAIGRMVLVAADSNEQKIDSSFLLDPNTKTITIANPEHAPYGKAAKETLESWGIWEEIQPKLVFAENIRQAYQFVESENADVGFIALSLMNEAEFNYELIDEANHKPILQALAIPKQSEQPELSKQLADFIISSKGQEILKSYGFDTP
ncbi:molybdate ABC transporter substrate-binding protein [Bacillus suaedae]|uniref:Molybdate ABC transporter substrate-binding protein n=1 Tax=Halalkalibacter suaedae TaxID=2822140 RepID=A0A940WVV9_9BACI|nr:molybdate ABC transporter substrate-binding protein [Bacillus suaedae]MBP3951442.1 molybdate ABC transporter substrate-binding protein [Bacillus suaedae]